MHDMNYGVLEIALFLCIYLIPTFVAYKRGHHNKVAICLLNLFAGWSVIGWIGAVIWASTNVKKRQEKNEIQKNKQCPFCAETIKEAANICRFCGHDQEQEREKTNRTKKFNEHIGELELTKDGMTNKTYEEPKNISKFLVIFSTLLMIAGCYSLISFGFFYDYSYTDKFDLPDWYASLHKFNDITYSASVILAGLFLFFRHKLIRVQSKEKYSQNLTDVTTGSCLNFFGIKVDLLVTLIVMLFILFIFHLNIHIQLGNLILIFDKDFHFYLFGKFISFENKDLAIYVAIFSLMIGVLLMKKGSELSGAITSILSIAYVLSRLSESYTLDKSWMDGLPHGLAYINISPYLSVLVLSIAFPHLQLIRIGSLKYGKLHGDLEMNIFRHKVYLPFSSAFVFYVLWSGVELFYFMSWRVIQ